MSNNVIDFQEFQRTRAIPNFKVNHMATSSDTPGMSMEQAIHELVEDNNALYIKYVTERSKREILEKIVLRMTKPQTRTAAHE